MGARPVCSLVVRSRWKILLFVMVDPSRTPTCDLVLLPTNNAGLWSDNTCSLSIRHVRPIPAFCRMFRKSRGLRTHGATTVSYRLGRPGS
ncbi:hypothetical protein J3E73DRAFT_391370 [Bipolaris maydis]|nr:hypothetical protein J3E73DRAFT_395505 [Bipolaris maydis]KAJ5026118.1 hypothetical protein J3E73DRAFT_391370 [Bipolaris maydis]